SEAGNHFVQDQQHAIAIADLTHAFQISIRGRQHAAAADHRLEDHRCDALWSLHANYTIELIGADQRAAGLARTEVAAVVVRWRDVKEARNQRLERLLAEDLACRRERAHREAVIR